jgi:DNA-binding transcriptional regulator YhcF (GntR family)
MEFRNHKAIYLQIADYVCEKALVNEWKTGERIPSVRELGVLLEVNPNTVMRSYEYLDASGIIYNRRGIGFFLADNALDKIRVMQKELFMSESLPPVFKNIYLLQISFDELKKQYNDYCATNYPNN